MRAGCQKPAESLHSGSSVSLDVPAEAAQRAEDLVVVLVVGAQLDAIALRDGERDFEDVDRVEPEPLPVPCEDMQNREQRLPPLCPVPCDGDHRALPAMRLGSGREGEILDLRQCTFPHVDCRQRSRDSRPGPLAVVRQDAEPDLMPRDRSGPAPHSPRRCVAGGFWGNLCGTVSVTQAPAVKSRMGRMVRPSSPDMPRSSYHQTQVAAFRRRDRARRRRGPD
jgi:hypothetical protein